MTPEQKTNQSQKNPQKSDVTIEFTSVQVSKSFAEPNIPGIPDKFWEKLKKERPDGLNWDRVEAAMDVLRGDKIAVAPKPPEPEPTLTQKRARKIFESHEQNPYVDRNTSLGKWWDAVKESGHVLVTDPAKFFREYREIDKKLRMGRDLGDIKDRLERSTVFSAILVGAVAFDKLVSMRNLNKILAQRKDGAQVANPKYIRGGKEMQNEWFFLPVKDEKGIKRPAYIGRGIAKLFDVFADKYVVNGLNYEVQKRTGDKNFVSEFSEQLGDFSNMVVTNNLQDMINGTAIEMAVRIVSQFPIVGSFVEVSYAAINRKIVENPVNKLTGKAGAIGLGWIVDSIIRAKKGDESAPPLVDIAITSA